MSQIGGVERNSRILLTRLEYMQVPTDPVILTERPQRIGFTVGDRELFARQ
jgi:hypothetical protein